MTDKLLCSGTVCVPPFSDNGLKCVSWKDFLYIQKVAGKKKSTLIVWIIIWFRNSTSTLASVFLSLKISVFVSCYIVKQQKLYIFCFFKGKWAREIV